MTHDERMQKVEKQVEEIHAWLFSKTARRQFTIDDANEALEVLGETRRLAAKAVYGSVEVGAGD